MLRIPAELAKFRGETADNNHERVRTPMATTPQHNGPAPVVFLVDDEEPIRELIGMALSGRGYTVHTCAESRKASAMAAALPNAPDLLITDIHMAGLAGPDLAAQMSVQFPGLRILFISGYANTSGPASATLRFKDAGYLRKPFSLQEFRATVDKVLTAKQ
jgi:two-component system, cell cycle sensor histidine kinase and response regulator CckA